MPQVKEMQVFVQKMGMSLDGLGEAEGTTSCGPGFAALDAGSQPHPTLPPQITILGYVLG